MTQSPMPLNEDSAEAITSDLTAKSEWIGFIAQAGAILSSTFVDKLTREGRALLIVLAIAHLGLAAWAKKKQKGPFTYGPPWGAVWLSMAAVMPVLLGFLLPPGEYGSSPACVQMCGYPVGPLVIFAFYPWGFPGKRWKRPSMQVLVLAALILEPLLLYYITNGLLNRTILTATALSGMLNVLAFLAGREVRLMCARAARAQFEGLDAAYRRQTEWLHSEANSMISTIQDQITRGDGRAEIEVRLEKLKKLAADEHNQLAVSTEHVNVLSAIRKALEVADPTNQVSRDLPDQIGGEVAQPIGQLISLAVVDLLHNASKFGAPPVHVQFRVDNRIAFLVVSDSGAGFSAKKLDNEATNLNMLRKRARGLGGDLEVVPEYHEGARVRLYLPLFEPR